MAILSLPSPPPPSTRTAGVCVALAPCGRLDRMTGFQSWPCMFAIVGGVEGKGTEETALAGCLMGEKQEKHGEENGE